MSAFQRHTPDDDIHKEIESGLDDYNNGRYDDAIRHFNTVIGMTDNKYPMSEEEWNFRGQAFHYLNDYYEAIRCFDEALWDNQDYLEPLFNKALSLRRLGKSFECMEALNQYLSKDSKSLKVQNVKGVLYDDLGNYSKALECFELVLHETKNTANPEEQKLRITVLNNKAMSLANDGQYALAWQIIKSIEKEELLKQEEGLSKQAFILDTKAFILFREGHYEESKNILREATQKSHYDKYVWYHLGNVYSKLKKTDQALRSYREAIKIDKGFAEAYNDLAAELAKSERYEEAREALEKALKIKPELVTAHENLIRISLRHHIAPTFWDYWTGSTYKKIAGATIFVFAVFLIALPIVSMLVGPMAMEIISDRKNASAIYEKINSAASISLPFIIGSGILAVIILAPTIKSAKVGALEFTFIDSQRSVQPLSNVE